MVQIVEDNDLDNMILCQEVMDIAKSVLSERELEMIILYTIDNVSYNQLGKDYGLSGSRIAQIIYYGIWKIRKSMEYTKVLWFSEYGYYKSVTKNRLFDCEVV